MLHEALTETKAIIPKPMLPAGDGKHTNKYRLDTNMFTMHLKVFSMQCIV